MIFDLLMLLMKYEVELLVKHIILKLELFFDLPYFVELVVDVFWEAFSS